MKQQTVRLANRQTRIRNPSSCKIIILLTSVIRDLANSTSQLKQFCILVFVILLSGCSIQKYSDRAEQLWLSDKTQQSALHEVELNRDISPVVSGLNNIGSALSARTRLAGKIQTPDLTELSGLAPVIESRFGSENVYWAINDSGNAAELFAITEDGKQIAKITLPIANRDWEDLASFVLDGQPWLMIAETGDNLRRHDIASLYFFKQPDLANPPESLQLQHQINFTYEDGPQNIESVAVSLSDKTILLVSKDAAGANIYSLPLSFSKSGSDLSIARKAGQMARLFQTSDDHWWELALARRLLFSPTAMDISADDRLAVVANYRHAYLFRRNAGEDWASALGRKPQLLSSYRTEQTEAVAFAPGIDKILVGSEGRFAPLLSVVPGNIAP